MKVVKPNIPFKVKNAERKDLSYAERFYLRVIDGFIVTFSHLFKKKVTFRYPEEKKTLQTDYKDEHYYYRGRHYLDLEKCVACEFCATACPCNIIYIVGEPHSEKMRHPAVFNIDILKCIFCGYCVQACPTNALHMTNIFEIVGTSRFILTIDEISTPP